MPRGTKLPGGCKPERCRNSKIHCRPFYILKQAIIAVLRCRIKKSQANKNSYEARIIVVLMVNKVDRKMFKQHINPFAVVVRVGGSLL